GPGAAVLVAERGGGRVRGDGGGDPVRGRPGRRLLAGGGLDRRPAARRGCGHHREVEPHRAGGPQLRGGGGRPEPAGRRPRPGHRDRAEPPSALSRSFAKAGSRRPVAPGPPSGYGRPRDVDRGGWQGPGDVWTSGIENGFQVPVHATRCCWMRGSWVMVSIVTRSSEVTEPFTSQDTTPCWGSSETA